MRTLLFFIVAILALPMTARAEDETFTNSSGSTTWAGGTAGLSGKKVGTGATVSVASTATVNAGKTAVVKYRIGVIQTGVFYEITSYSRNLMAGAGQAISNDFTNLPFGTELTVKVSMTFPDGTLMNHTDRTITVAP